MPGPKRHLDNGWLGQYVNGFNKAKAKINKQVAINKAVYNNKPPLNLQQAKQRHSNIAKAYFSQAPTISNLYNGAVNWLKSKNILTPDNTGVLIGDVPTPNSINSKINNVNSVRSAVQKLSQARNAATAPTNVATTTRAASRIASTANSAPPAIARQIGAQTASTKKLRYASPITTPNANIRNSVFNDYIQTGNTDNVIQLVAKEQHIPENIVRDFLSDSRVGTSDFGRRMVSEQMGMSDPRNLGFVLNNRIRRHYDAVINSNYNWLNAINNAYSDVGLRTPMLTYDIADNMRYTGNIQDAIKRTIESDLRDPSNILNAIDIDKAIANSKVAQNFMRTYNLSSRELSKLGKLMGRTHTFDELGKNTSDLLRRTGATSDLKTMLNRTSKDINSSTSAGDLNFHLLTGRRLHPDFPRGRFTGREMLDKVNEKIALAMRPDSQYSINEVLDNAFSANSAPMIISKVGDLMRARKSAGLYPGRVIPNYASTATTNSGNSFANVNLGTLDKPRIGTFTFGDRPTEEVIKTYPNRETANNLINLKLAKLYKTIKGLFPKDYVFDDKMLNDVIKASGDISKVKGADKAVWNNTSTPLWSVFPETSEAPIYPNLLFQFKYGGPIHINPANRGALTETMRRTGKTKYQLAHSSNPLTRKRAIFAINAAKWNHG